jgi:predicted DNA-binding ribbon-helix-helix protein
MIVIDDSEGTLMESLVVKRSVVLDGHKTSVSVEDAFWNELKEIAHGQRMTVSSVLRIIDSGRQEGSNLSSSIRLFVLDHVRTRTPLSSGNRVAANGESRVD